MNGWDEGQVASSTHMLDVKKSKVEIDFQPVSPRLRAELIHPVKNGPVNYVQYSPDGSRIIAGDRDSGVVQVWDASTGDQLLTIETGPHLQTTSYFFFVSPDWTKLYSINEGKQQAIEVNVNGTKKRKWNFNGSVKVWNLKNGKPIKTFRHDPPRSPFQVRLSSNGKWLCTWDDLPGIYENRPDRRFSLWNIETGKVKELSSDLTSGGEFSPGSEFVVFGKQIGSDYQAVQIYEPASGKKRLEITPPHPDRSLLMYSGFSPNEKTVFIRHLVRHTSMRGYSKISVDSFSTKTGKKLGSFVFSDGNTIFGAARIFSNKLLATFIPVNGREHLNLIDAQSMGSVHSIPICDAIKNGIVGHGGPVVSPGGKWLAVVTQPWPRHLLGANMDPRDFEQPRIHLIDAAKGSVVETISSPQTIANLPVFSPDGKTLATGGLGRVLLWDMSQPPGKFRDTASSK